MSTAAERLDERPKLEAFDGSDPGAYKAWRRRARLMLAGLPSTVNASKYGARLMEFVKGEAEALLETVEVEDIIKEGGEKTILAILDEKYLPQPRDLLQEALRGFFYDLVIKPGETYQQFLTRFDTALRKLKTQEVVLPDVVLGFMLLRKLKMEPNQESMILTATGGKMDIKDVVTHVRAIFPEGKGTSRNKEVFEVTAEASSSETALDLQGHAETIEDVLEVITDPLQGSGDEEEALEIFESYVEVRKKLQEKKKSRGFMPRDEASQWRVSGTLKGRIDLLKQKTRCHICKRLGHWKKECPEKASRSSTTTTKSKHVEKEAHATEVMSAEVVQLVTGNAEHDRVWQIFDAKPAKAVNWKSSVDVQKDGFADSHATGNRQRLEDMAEREEKIPTTVAMTDDLEGPMQKNEVMILPKHISHGNEVLSAEAEVSFSGFDPALSRNAIPDTACRRTLIGSYTLRQLEQHLLKQGKVIIKRNEKNEFRFGNNGTLVSKEVAIIPACVNRKRILIRASILPDSGCLTPLLLSKEFLRDLGAEINMNHDIVVFRALGTEIKLNETQRGHYAIPMFDFCDECFKTDQTDGKCKNERIFNITALELGEQNSPEERTVLAVPRHEQDDGCRSGENDGECQEHASEDGHDYAGAGCSTRSSQRRFSLSDAWRHDHQGGQVCKAWRDEECGKTVRERQRVHGVDPQSHQQQVEHGDATTEDLHLPEGCSEKGSADARESSRHGSPSSSMDGDGVISQHDHDERLLEQRLEPCEFGRDNRPSTPRDASHTGAAERDSGELGEHGEKPVSELSAEGEPDDDAHQCDASQDPCTVHDEHDHVLVCDQNFSCNAADVPDIHVRNHGRQTKEKSDGGVLKKNTRRELERNIHDINVCCNHEEGWNSSPIKHDLFVVQVQHDKMDVGEVFSLPRVLPAAERTGLKGLRSYDLGTGWNFLNESHRKQCREEIQKHGPEVLMVSPPCGPFSQIKRISKFKENAASRERKLIEGRVLLQFAMELCELQHSRGKIFIFEHPSGADSWWEDCLQHVRRLPGVNVVDTCQCMFGLRDPQNHKLYKKPTTFMSNSEFLHMLQRQCNHKHDHQRIEGQTRLGGRWINRSTCAQVYPYQLVKQMVRMVWNEKWKKQEHEAHEVMQHEVFTGEWKTSSSDTKNSKEREEERLAKIKAYVRVCHVNLGHPSRERFIHMLKSANAHEDAIEYAKQMQCSTCSSNRLKDLRGVAKYKRSERFNEQLCMDTFELPIYQQKKLKVLNIVCEGTGMQVCVPLWRGSKASEVRKAYRKYWLRWAGKPRRVLTDGGGEFDAEMQLGLDRDGTLVDKTAAYAPWQNAIAERGGGA